jgi:RNA polymerase sigma-70 factor (ECF subfamily)
VPADNETTIVSLIPALRAFARTWYKNPTDADDLVQDTLTRALGSISQFQDGTSMKSWMFTIMRNTFLTRFKISSREAPGASDCVSGRRTMEASQEWSVRGNEIQQAISRLPAHQREVVVLVAMLGFSYEEAAAVCKVSTGTIKSRLNRARVCLLDQIGENSSQSAIEPAAPISVERFEADLSVRH